MNIAALLARAGRVYRDLPGLARGEEVIATYGDWMAASASIAHWLSGPMAMAPGDRVAIIAKNSPDYLIAQWGAWAAGLVATPINAKLHTREFAYILEHSGARLALASDDLCDAVADAAREAPALERVISLDGADWRRALAGEAVAIEHRDRDDPAWLFYTSGTTGRPKGALLTHGNLLAATTSYFLDIDEISPGEAILHPAPLSHGAGMYVAPHVARGAVNVTPESGGFDPAEIAALCARWPGASLFAAPTMVRRFVTAPAVLGADLSGLKTIVYGGGPMHVADVKRALEVLGPKLAQLYGQGESPMCITGLRKEIYADAAHPRWEARIASAGYPQTVVEARVVDADDNPLPVGELGEVVARGAPVMAGYWRNPEATAKTLRGGWLHTGDVGSFDEDGFLTLKDRANDMIISGGSNIYPREVEEVLLTHPAVREASVVGRPHADWGEEVVAFVVADPAAGAADAAALDALCRDNIARFKRPKEYRFVEALPKNNYGKIVKRELRELLAGGRDGARSDAAG